MGNIEAKPRPIIYTITWKQLDEELRLAHNKRVKNSQKPSMWEYDPTGGMPTELAYLDLSSFLTSSLGKSLCFLPKDVLTRICSMLPVRDFLNLSYTCRFLHWRMFTFCTCYVPYTVKMYIGDNLTEQKNVPPKWAYTLNNGVITKGEDYDGLGHNFYSGPAAVNWKYPMVLDGQRGIFIEQPFCLRKPFFFDTLKLYLILPFYYKKYFDGCLPYITPVRGLVRHLDIIFVNRLSIPATFFNFSDTNDFLAILNTNYYDNIERIHSIGDIKYFEYNNVHIFMNCPYARQMAKVFIARVKRRYLLNVPVFENRIGSYQYPMDSPILETLENFLSGSPRLVYHQYFNIIQSNGRFLLIEYLFEKFGEFEEYFYVERRVFGYMYYHGWKKVVETENGEQLRIIIIKSANGVAAYVKIGKEETFDEIDYKHTQSPIYHEDNYWWVMETAVEPEEFEEELDESDTDEEEQRAYYNCLCLNNTSCSIQ